jgi:hypothetical protein
MTVHETALRIGRGSNPQPIDLKPKELLWPPKS